MLSERGAGIVSVVVPDRNGVMGDVVLGYKDEESYLNDGPCMGKIPGRYANRIADGRFCLDGKWFDLVKNHPEYQLHGGPDGFANRLWKVLRSSERQVLFALDSPDGDQGYPGNMHVEALYSWEDDNSLRLELTATTDAPTVINLTNHTYWNLDGEDSGSIFGHNLRLNASRWLITDASLVPTGEIASVNGTPMDFRKGKPIGQDIKADFPALKYGKGYDNCWIIDGTPVSEEVPKSGDISGSGKIPAPVGAYGAGEAPASAVTAVEDAPRLEETVMQGLKPAAELSSAVSGRRLEVWTDQPAAQVYTGNWLEGSPVSKSGRSYHDYDGVAIECQDLPDAPNHPAFPSTELRPGQTYRRTIIFKLSVD